MPRLNKTTINLIYENLDSSGFTMADFKVDLPDETTTLVKIEFTGNPTYWFNIMESYSGLTSRMSPGEFKTTEDHDEKDLGSAISLIPKWCKLLKEELLNSIPVYAGLAEAQERFERDLAEHIKDPNVHLNQEDILAITKKLEAMFAEFEKLKEEKQITDKELKYLRSEIEDMKRAAKAYPKGIFVRTCVNRMGQWTKKVAKGETVRQVVISATKTVLGLPY